MYKNFRALVSVLLAALIFAGCSGKPDKNTDSAEIKVNSVGELNYSSAEAVSLLKATPSVSSEMLKNPYKGWFVYGEGDDNMSPFGSQNIAWDYASLGYCRFNWCDIEPEEGKYDWSYIESAINECKENGAKFAFGVMSADPSSGKEYITPKWVFDAGAKYYKSQITDMLSDAVAEQYVPDFGDPIYIEKVQNFANALAKRYGNNPYIEFIDIRCYGAWGENNMFDIAALYKEQDDTGVNAEDMWKCWETYINAFEKTDIQLMVAYSLKNNALKDVFQKAIDRGVGIRDDGLMHWTAVNTGECNTWGINKVPTVLELAASYDFVLDKGSWDSAFFEETIASTRTSYYPLGGAWPTDATSFITAEKGLVEDMTNRIGYHFTLNEVMLSPTLGSGENDVMVMRWTNGGNAPIFHKTYLAAALVDEKGKIIEKCWLDGVDMRDVAPSMDSKTEYNSYTLSSPLKFTKSNKNYKIAVGIFSSKDLKNPDIKIGNKDKTKDGWYIAYDPEKLSLEQKNYAAFCKVEASSSFSEKHSAQNAADLNYMSAWSSEITAEEQTVLYDLGKAQEISTLELFWGANYAKQYKVMLSNDNKNFTEIYSTATSDGGQDYIGFAKQKVRYIKLILQSSGQTGDDSAGFEAKQGVNILRNPGFEDGLNSWNMNESAAKTSSDTHSGMGSAYISARTTDSGSLQQNLAGRLIQTGTGKYEVSGWFKSEKDALATISIYAKGTDDWGSYLFLELGELKAGEWTKLSGEINIDWKGSLSYAYLTVPDTMVSTLSVLVDDIEVKKLDPVNGEVKFVPITEGSYTLLDVAVY